MSTMLTKSILLKFNLHVKLTTSLHYQTVDDLAGTAMFPPIVAYEVGSLKVSDIHTIAYSLYGNPSGTVYRSHTII